MSSDTLDTILNKFVHAHQIQPGAKVKLSEYATNHTPAYTKPKEKGQELLTALQEELKEQQLLTHYSTKHADHAQWHKILIVLQGLDTSGKDGVITNSFRGFNALGVNVSSIKKPSEEELMHDYLWRIHKLMPEFGDITILNRSHYEDVIPVRVHNLVPQKQWSKRYDHINRFEEYLTDEGLTILKFFLHISYDEQGKNLKERLANPQKQAKFTPADLEERKFWKANQAAYEAVLTKTSTIYAPWHIIPADRNWYRNLAVGAITLHSMKQLSMEYPKLDFDPQSVIIS